MSLSKNALVIRSSKHKLVTHPNAVRAADNCYFNYERPWILPPSTSLDSVIQRHSMRNIFVDWRPGMPIQFILHRGLARNALGRPDNSIVALMDGCKISNCCEIDALLTKDGIPIVTHDIEAYRMTNLAQGIKWSSLDLEDVVQIPTVLPNVSGASFTEKFTAVDDAVMSLEACLLSNWDVNPDNSFVIDARQKEAGRIIAYLSKLPNTFKRCAVNFYPYEYDNALELVRDVECYSPSATWKTDVFLIPILDADAVTKIARLAPDSLDFDKMVEAGKKFTKSFFDTKLNVKGVCLPFSPVGHCVDLVTSNVVTPHGEAFGPVEKSNFYHHLALQHLTSWARGEFPVAIVGVCRSWEYIDGGIKYYYNWKTGVPNAWAKGAMGYIRERRSDPIVIAQYFDWVITDFYQNNIEGVAANDASTNYDADKVFKNDKWFYTK